MGKYAAKYAFNVTGLKCPQQAILQRVAWHCMDQTGFLPWSRETLAARCGMSARTLERHLPRLDKLGKLSECEGGFRLPEYLSHAMFRQNVGQNVGHFVGDGKKKESTKERKIQNRIGGELVLEAAEAAAAAITSPPIDPGASDYLTAVIGIFVGASGRPPRTPTSADWTLAERFRDEGIPLAVVESAILQILIRHLQAALGEGVTFSSTHPLAYYAGAIREEKRRGAPSDVVLEFLRHRVRELKAHMDAPRQAELAGIPETSEN